ncbi:MAG: CHAD domain-containing protein [Acidobacteriota bacterium]
MSKPLKVKKISGAISIRKAAVRILRTRLKEFYSHWPNPQVLPTPEQLHHLRISGKRLRYSAEQLRELYADRLALLIDVLKRSQDLLGEVQDCVTQRAVFEAELPKRLGRKPDEAAALERLMAICEQRQQTLFAQFLDIWRGMAMREFRASLKAMVSNPQPKNFRDEAEKAFTAKPFRE